MPAEKLLSDKACDAAKPRQSIYYLNDGAGLRLQVRPNSARYWLLRYRLGGKESTFQIGSYPDVGLREARKRASAARELVAQGRSPSVEKRVQKAAAIQRSAGTFQSVADEWLERHRSDWSTTHYERNQGLLRRIVFPKLGCIPIAEITEPMLLGVLKAAYDAGTRESARRARGVCAQVFAYAKNTHRATHNPARELADSSVLKKPEVRHFAALRADQVGPMLRALNASGSAPTVKAALLAMLFTGLRDYSLRAACWSEIDLETAVWTIPAERMKRRQQHTVPLPRQAVTMFRELANLTRKAPDSLVFASHSKHGHLAENTLRKVLHDLGFEVTAHGIRSLITDVLNEAGFNADAIERQMHHVEKDKVRAAYLRSDFFEYRRTMMQWFADWLAAQVAAEVAPALPDNVLQFRRVA